MMVFLISPKISPVFAGNEGFAQDLFISEYIEGSSNNKAIEIYNGTSSLVDMSGYALQLYVNGSQTPAAPIKLNGKINPGDVFVISNKLANDDIKAMSDMQSGNLTFNGDDAVELVKGTTPIDIIGDKVKDSTEFKDKTFLRNSSISSGNTVYTADEWVKSAKDDISNLGFHTMDSFPAIPIKTARAKASNTIVTVLGTVTFIDGTNYYIQDSTAAIDVYFKTGLKLSVGDLVLVKGAIGSYKGLTEVVPAEESDVSILTTGSALPDPMVTTLNMLISEDDQCRRIKLEDVKLGTIDTTNKTLVTDINNNTIYIYKIPDMSKTGINAGDIVDIICYLSVYNDTLQLRVDNASDITIKDTVPPVITHTQVLNGSTAEDLTISAVITDDHSISQANLYYRTKGASAYKSIPMTKENNNYTAVIPKSDLDPAGLEYYIEAKDSVNTATYPEVSTSPCQVSIIYVDVTGPTVTSITPAAGDTTGDNKKPEISASYSDPSGIDVSSVKLYLDNTDITSLSAVSASKIDYTPKADLKDGNHSLRLEIKDNSAAKNLTTKEWSFTVGKVLYNTYFGMIHSHTNYSDGQGTPEEAYAMAKANADFFAVTDHSNSLDNDKNAALLNADGTEKDCSSISTEWKSLHDTADKYNEDGKFAAIAGYEMTWSGSTGGYGHINTFNTKGFETRNHSSENLQKYYEDISKIPSSISQLNHPGTTFGDFEDFSYRTDAADSVVNLIEVGNGEGAIGSSGYFSSYDYYTKALDKGWHLAPTNNQDNHLGKWIISNEARTVILAPSISRAELYKALKEMRVYSTEDKNLNINYTVNNKIMGSMLGDPVSLNFNVSVNDPDITDKIGRVSVIVNGGETAVSKEFTTNSASWNFTLDPKYSYYYLRIDEEDGDIAVTAPVWVGDAISAGLSSVTVSNQSVEVNTPVKVTANLFNNGSLPYSSIKVEFFKNAVTADNKIGEAICPSLPESGTSAVSIDFTPDKAGSYTIYARTTLNINGKNKTFTENTSIKAINPEDVIKVVIDAGHYNQYVSGDYSNMVEKFKDMAVNCGYLVYENTNELTASDLNKAALLVLTDPQSVDNSKFSLYKSKYSDAEISAIKQFVQNGGSLIITSRADYNDAVDTEYQSSYQGNKVLEAIGSNLRFNDDEAVDNTENGGQTFRLSFDDFLNSKYGLTDSIPETTTYSFFSGCSVIPKANADLSNVEVLVKGHSTTETMDSDNQGDSTPVAKGSVIALADEIIGKGKVIVAGSTFFSDFEISGDNANANLQITSNVLKWTCEKEIPFSTIKALKADTNKDGILDNLGKKFTVEGYITAGSDIKDNTFFDVIYVQDATGGITIFGVSAKSLPLGTKVRVTGTVDEYEGDSELQISNENTDIQIISSDIHLVEPALLSASESMKEENEGLLVKVIGTVTKIQDNNIYVNDGSGTARVYLNGYIGDGSGDSSKLGKWDSSIQAGTKISAIGLASQDASGHRLRVRNSAEIVKLSAISERETLNFYDEAALLSLINNESVKVITVQADSDQVISKSVFEALKGQNKTLIVKVPVNNNPDITEIEFTFSGVNMKPEDIKDLDLSLKAAPEYEAEILSLDKDAEILSFNGSGALPGIVQVRIKLGGIYSSSDKFYFYYYNPVTKKAELISGALTPDKDGYIIAGIKHFSDYFISKNSALASKLPKTGSPIDMSLLVFLGILLIAAGGYYILSKKEKETEKK